MPIYGYRCSNCGHQFEIQQRMSDEPLKECPKCQGRLTKVIYPAGVIFKGGGFYSTDYKASSNGSDSSSETKTETKSESKSESASGTSD